MKANALLDAIAAGDTDTVLKGSGYDYASRFVEMIDNEAFVKVYNQSKANAARVRALLAVLDEVGEALEWFCNRVDAGEVRSKKSYARFKDDLATLAKTRQVCGG